MKELTSRGTLPLDARTQISEGLKTLPLDTQTSGGGETERDRKGAKEEEELGLREGRRSGGSILSATAGERTWAEDPGELPVCQVSPRSPSPR